MISLLGSQLSRRFILETLGQYRLGNSSSIFRQFLTSIWYPAYKVGADRSYDRYPCATRTEGIYCNRSTVRAGRHSRRAHESVCIARACTRDTRVCHTRVIFTFTPRTVRSLRCEITSLAGHDIRGREKKREVSNV